MTQYSPKDLTPIFPPEIKPTRSGVYLARSLVMMPFAANKPFVMYSYYDVESDTWSIGRTTLENAFKYKNLTYHNNKYWQGLNYNPEP